MRKWESPNSIEKMHKIVQDEGIHEALYMLSYIASKSDKPHMAEISNEIKRCANKVTGLIAKVEGR